MKIGGFIDISTKDIPKLPSMVIFTVGCNFNCGYCHNKYLLQDNVGKEYDVSEIITKVKLNSLISGVSITGGEPTLQPDISDLCRELKLLNKYVSVDSNGSNPVVIRNLLPYVNRIALDLKFNPLDNVGYSNLAQTKVDTEKIIETIKLLNATEAVKLEIRTTYVLPLMEAKDINDIIVFLTNLNFTGDFVLQQYQYSNGVGAQNKDAFQKPEHLTLVQLLEKMKERKFPFTIYLRDEIVGYRSIEDLFNQNKNEL